jgi:hypothetical protein
MILIPSNSRELKPSIGQSKSKKEITTGNNLLPVQKRELKQSSNP